MVIASRAILTHTLQYPKHNGVSNHSLALHTLVGQAATHDATAVISRGHGCKQHALAALCALAVASMHRCASWNAVCAYNATQHQQGHAIPLRIPHCKQPIFGLFKRAHTGSDAWDHASPIVHARTAPHGPYFPANSCIAKRTHKTLQAVTHRLVLPVPLLQHPARAMRRSPAHVSASSETP